MIGGNIVSRGFGYDNRIVTRGYVERLIPIYRPIIIYTPVDSIYFKTRLTQGITLYPTIILKKESRLNIVREIVNAGTLTASGNALTISMNLSAPMGSTLVNNLYGTIVTQIRKSAIMDKDITSIEETSNINMFTKLHESHAVTSYLPIEKHLSARLYQEET